MRIRGKNVSAGIACLVLLFTLFFTVMPGPVMGDLVQLDRYWGVPAPDHVVEYSGHDESASFLWGGLAFDLIFWPVYFSIFGFGIRDLLRKIGLNIHVGFCLIASWFVTVALYSSFLRPDVRINEETGGYFSFLESRSTQIEMAIRYGDIETLKAILKNHPDSVLVTNRFGETPLHNAAYWGQSEIVKLLLADKATIEARETFTGHTPLSFAALCGNTSSAELLIRAGANINARNYHGETVLNTAVEEEYVPVALVQLLLANKADINAADVEGYSPLQHAVFRDNKDVARLLIASNAQINIKDNQGETPLFYAAEYGKLKMAELLVSNNADVNVRDKYGFTLLQLAETNEQTNIVELLRRHGASENGRANGE